MVNSDFRDRPRFVWAGDLIDLRKHGQLVANLGTFLASLKKRNAGATAERNSRVSGASPEGDILPVRSLRTAAEAPAIKRSRLNPRSPASRRWSSSRPGRAIFRSVCNRSVRFAVTVARGHATFATKRALPLGRVPHRQRSGRRCRNEKPFGTKFLATASALLSEVSSAIFWDSMTSPLGSSPSGRKHSPSFGRPFPSTSQTFVIAPA